MLPVQPTAHHFFIFVGFMVLCTLAATSLALCIAAWARTTDMAVTVLPMVSSSTVLAVGGRRMWLACSSDVTVLAEMYQIRQRRV